MSRTAENSPWRQWRQDQLRALLPPEPPGLDGLLRVARDDNATASARAGAIALLVVRLEKWFDEFATAAADAEATDGSSPQAILHRARQKEAGAGGQPSP